MKSRKTIRLVGAGLAVAMSLTMAACSGGANPTTPGGEPGKTDAPAATGGRVYYLNFKPEAAKDWEALAKAYTDETGVPVAVQTAASGTYEATLKSEMAKSEAPTLFQVNGPVGMATWQDYAADLTDTAVFKHLADKESALKSADGAVQAVPFALETYGIIYNKALLAKYLALPGAKAASVEEINSFDALKAVVEDIQAKKADLGIEGAFTSAGFDSSSDWRFKTHLANVPLYYEFKADNVVGQPATVTGSYLGGYQKIFDLYINNSTTDRKLLSSKTGEDATADFALAKAVFYQNGTWAYNDIKGQKVADEDLGMLPIYIGADGEQNQGLCTGSENYWVINNAVPEADQAATAAFLEWVITSDKGRDALANTMGFTTPFDTFGDFQSTNPLILADKVYQEAGKTPVSWNFTAMPSQEWKDVLGQALLAYAQETGGWDAVKTAFVDNWAAEYKLAHS